MNAQYFALKWHWVQLAENDLQNQSQPNDQRPVRVVKRFEKSSLVCPGAALWSGQYNCALSLWSWYFAAGGLV